MVAAADDHPAARLHALADAYLAFTREQPHVHDLANGPAVAERPSPAAAGRNRILESAPRHDRGLPATWNPRGRDPPPSCSNLGNGLRHLPPLSLRTTPSLRPRLGR